MSTPEASYVFQSVIKDKSPMVVSSKGLYLTVEDPKTGEHKVILDAMTGAAVGSLPHHDEDIVEAMCDAARNSTYTFGLYISNYAAEQLGKFICDRSDGAFASSLFTGSGSESNENAMKFVKQYHLERGDKKRFRFISRKQAYHGFTTGALSIGDGIRKRDYVDILLTDDQCPKVSQMYPYRHMKEGETSEQYGQRLVDELEQCFIDHDPETIAGVFMETVGGSSFGTCVPVPGYLDGCKKVCEKYGALFVLDEVMCGLGRCGAYHAWQKYMTTGGPDLQTIGKTLGSGFVTLSGVLISPKVKNVIAAGSGATAGAQTYHSHDFNCRVGLAVQQKIDRDNLVENSEKMGLYLEEQLKSKLSDSPVVGDIRGAGLFWSLEFVKDKKTKETFPTDVKFCYRLQDKCFENGITTMAFSGTVDGLNGDHISIAPAYTITKPDIDSIVEIMAKSVDQMAAEVST
ncbi:transferase activity protein [[Candida] boidinii]|nr:transferase activity protein [[Candida] boidinii]